MQVHIIPPLSYSKWFPITNIKNLNGVELISHSKKINPVA